MKFAKAQILQGNIDFDLMQDMYSCNVYAYNQSSGGMLYASSA